MNGGDDGDVGQMRRNEDDDGHCYCNCRGGADCGMSHHDDAIMVVVIVLSVVVRQGCVLHGVQVDGHGKLDAKVAKELDESHLLHRPGLEEIVVWVDRQPS
uniref:Uncharacterized protein n=1 Tax=Romanomermis culicivorax TaxID=13658 RepID=A0A915KCZ5_ROMCU